MLTLLWPKKLFKEIKLLPEDKAIKKAQIYSILKNIEEGSDAEDQEWNEIRREG